MKTRKAISVLLALTMILALVAGCGSSSSSDASKAASSAVSSLNSSAVPSSAKSTETSASVSEESSETASASADFVPVAVPAVPDLGGKTANEWLLSQSDQKPLGGVSPSHLNSRADVYKALDKVDPADDHITIAWMMATMGSDFFTELLGSAKAAADKYGYELIEYNADFDLTAQMDQFENVMTLDMDYIMCNAMDTDALSMYFTQATDAGIPVLVTAPITAKENYNIVTSVIASSWNMGYKVGAYCAEQLWGQFPEGIKVGFLCGQIGFSDTESRACGFISGYLDKYAELAGTPYDDKYAAGVIGYQTWVQLRDKGSATIEGIMNCVGYVNVGGMDPSTAAPASAELITAHPDMNLVMFETGSLGTSIITECINAGYTPGEDIYIAYAADGEGYICDYVKSGEVLCSGTNLPYPAGEGLIELIHAIQEEGFDANDLPANSFTPDYVITKDNVDQVYSKGDIFAKALEPWQVQTIDEYNAANS